MNKNNQPFVSIGIPFYNSEKFLADAINSVLKQSYTNWELILMDDGSSDTSLDIASKFESLDERITLVSDGKNRGLPARLNQLSNLARGTYYARMDADDLMFPNRIKEQVTYLEKHQEVDLVGSGIVSIDNENNIIGIRRNRFYKGFTLKDVLVSTWCGHPTITGKTKWFKSNPYDEQMKRAQDYELWIRTIEKSNFVLLGEYFLFYREASTPSLKKYKESTEFSLKIFWKNRKKIGKFDTFKLSVNKLFKLLIYLLFSIFGATDKLIQRRSVQLLDKEKLYYNEILNDIT